MLFYQADTTSMGFCIYEDCIRGLPWEYWIMRPRHLKVVICINHFSNLRIIRFTFTGPRSDHYLALSEPDPLHYRLRWPLGRFFEAKKCSKVRSYFSVETGIFVQIKLLWQGFDPDFVPKNFSKYLENKIWSQTLGKQEGSLSESWFFVWRGWEEKTQNSDFHGEIRLLK